MARIVIAGMSGHARVITDLIEKEGIHEIVGLLNPTPGELLGYPVLGDDADLPAIANAHGITGAIVAVGDNYLRAMIVKKLGTLCPTLSFPAAIHPSAILGRGTSVGAGTVVMAGAVINPCCTIGDHCIVNTQASLDHDCALGDFASLAPGVTVGGNCAIGDYSAIGIGATLRHGMTIGRHSIIGAGAVVVGPIASHTVAYGVPARKARDRQPGERYL